LHKKEKPLIRAAFLFHARFVARIRFECWIGELAAGLVIEFAGGQILGQRHHGESLALDELCADLLRAEIVQRPIGGHAYQFLQRDCLTGQGDSYAKVFGFDIRQPFPG
jgi:hypothetical protein